MHRHWGRDDQMGNAQMSKQLAPSQLGEARHDPRRTKAVLQAWAMGRTKQSVEWLVAHTRRHRQLARDKAELERGVWALPGPTTGGPEADDMLR